MTKLKPGAAPPTLPRVPLRGYERMMTMADNASVKIAHVMLLRGSAGAVATFLRHARRALALTFNKHPRMRVKQVRGEFATAEVHPATLSAAQVARDRLFEEIETSDYECRRRRASECASECECESGGCECESAWQQFVERECEVPFDRFASFPFYVRAWRHAPSRSAHGCEDGGAAVRVVLFSDHYMSDGISGLVVLNDVLAFASQLSADSFSGSKQSRRVERPVPLLPSLYDLWRQSRGLWRWMVSRLAVQIFGKRSYQRRLASFTPALPIRADQTDFHIPITPNTSSVLYDQGTPANLRAAQTSCKREDVTFFGALAASVVVAYFVVATAQDDAACAASPFRLAAGVDYNMRVRVQQPEPQTVGAYMCVKEIAAVATRGVVMARTRFWDLARQVKRDTERQVASFAMPAQLLMLDGFVHARTPPAFFADLPIPSSVVSDVGISSLGKYPHPVAHVLRTARGRRERLRVASVHYHSSTPHLGPAVGVYVSAVDALCYTMKHKHGAADGGRLFAALVAAAELIGYVGAADSMLAVAARVRAQLEP